MTRRGILKFGLASGATLGTGLVAPAIVLAEGRRPVIDGGVMSGDMLADRAMLWSRVDRPARMLLEIADNPEFRAARELAGPEALPAGRWAASRRSPGCSRRSATRRSTTWCG